MGRNTTDVAGSSLVDSSLGLVEVEPGGGGDVMPYKENVDFMLQSNGLPAINPPWSTITAYDMQSGEILWQVPNGEVMMLAQQGIRDTGSTAPRGGPVATAGARMVPPALPRLTAATGPVIGPRPGSV